MSRVAVDAGVFVDYIDRNSQLHGVARALVESFGRLEVFLSHVTVAETCYVTARVLKEAGVKDYFEKSLEFVRWLSGHPSVQVVGSIELDVEAARLKLEHGIALGDCYVLALSKLKNCRAVFRKREMPKELEEEFEVVFLEDYVGNTKDVPK